MGTAVGWVATFASTAILSVVRAGRSAELDAVGGTLIAVVVGGIVGGSSTAILSIVGADGGVELVVAMVSEGPTGGAGGEVVGGMATAILSVVGAGFCVVPVTNHRIIPPSTVATTPSEMRRMQSLPMDLRQPFRPRHSLHSRILGRDDPGIRQRNVVT